MIRRDPRWTIVPGQPEPYSGWTILDRGVQVATGFGSAAAASEYINKNFKTEDKDR